MKNKALFALSLSFFLLACGGNASSNTQPSSSSSEPASQTSASQEPSESTSEESSSSSERQSSSSSSSSSASKEESSNSTSSEASQESSEPGEESSSSEESSEIDDTDYPSSERFHSGLKDYAEPEDSRYGFMPQVAKVLPRIDVVDPNNKTDWATVPNRTNKWDYTSVGVTLTDENSEVIGENIACGIKVRGNYTADYSKKPFRLKFDKKQAMFGLNGGAKLKSWVLLADVKDAAMSRNAVAFYLGKNILGSDGLYCSDFRPVELYINGSYWGVYLLAEQQQINKNRVNIDDVTDREPEEGHEVYEGTDTGYLVEYDGYAPEEDQKADGDPTFYISYHNDGALTTVSGRQTQQLRDYMHGGRGIMNGFTIKSDIQSEAQHTFIGNYFENVYNLIYEAVYQNKLQEFNSGYTALVSSSASSVEECLAKSINIESFVDSYILSEICCDYDINWSSFYFSVDFSETGEKRLRMEAPWDFDSSLACRDAAGNGKSFFAAESQNAWMLLLQRQSWIQNRIKAKWAELVRNNVLRNCLHYLDYYRVFYKNYYDENYTRWGRSQGAGEWRNEISRLTTQAQHSNYVFTWLTGRLNWLSTQWGDGEPVYTIEPATPAQKMGNDIGANWVVTRYETENSTRSGGTLKTSDATASNGLYIGDLDGAAGISMEYTVNSSSAQTAFLKLGLSKRSEAGMVGDWYEFSINGVIYAPLNTTIPALSQGERDYHAWTEVNAGSFPLKKGNNTITIVTLGYGTNFDYIDVYAAQKLN